MCGGREGFGVSEAKPVKGQRWECDIKFKMKNKIIRKGGGRTTATQSTE